MIGMMRLMSRETTVMMVVMALVMMRIQSHLICGDKDCDAPAQEGSVEAVPLHESQELGDTEVRARN